MVSRESLLNMIIGMYAIPIVCLIIVYLCRKVVYYGKRIFDRRQKENSTEKQMDSDTP